MANVRLRVHTDPMTNATTTNPVFTLGDRLRKAREHAGLDQTTVARELEIARTTVGHYERDETTPKRRMLADWAELCGVSLAWLQGTEAALDSPTRRSRTSGGAKRDHRPAKKAATKPTAGPATHQYAGTRSRICSRRRHAPWALPVR